MNKIKDIIYDKNDLFIALVIVLIAGLVIYTRIDVIMAYPATLVAETESNGIVTGEDFDNWDAYEEEPIDDEPDTSNELDEEEPANETEEDNTPNGSNETEVTVEIEFGATGSRIAQILVDSGLISNTSEFYNAVDAASADTKLQAGTFKIPSNSTPAEIIDIITN